MNGRRPDRVFAALVVCAYLPVAIFAIAHHEMWRAALHCWLVARDSPWPWDVVHNRAYDGQPPLWYLLLWVLEKLTHAPVVMQAVHVAIAAAVVWVFASRAPLPRPLRALFPFGYFLAYEYVALSRCYGLALLLSLLVCVHHRRRFTGPWRMAALLAALSLTTTVSTVVTLAYAGVLALDALEAARRAFRGRRRSRVAVRALVPIGAALLGCAAAAACAFPPADSTVTHVTLPHALPSDDALTRILVALVPIPSNDFYFWNSNVLMASEAFRPIAGYFAFAAAVLVLVVLRRCPPAAVLFGVGSFGLWGLFAFVYGGDVRHHGFFFVLFLMGAWVAGEARPASGATPRATRALVGAVLVAHALGTPIALYWDGRYIFSSGARAAAYLREHCLSRSLLVAEMDFPATAMIGQLGNDAMAHTPRTGRTFSFVKWTADRRRDPSDEETLAYAWKLAADQARDVVLVMNRPLRPELVEAAGPARIERLVELYDSMIQEENFYLYRLPRPAIAAAAASAPALR